MSLHILRTPSCARPFWATHEMFSTASGQKVWTDCCACKVPAEDTVSRVVTSWDYPHGGLGSYEAPYTQEADFPTGAYYDPRIETVCAEGCGCNANPRKRWGMPLRAAMRDGA